MTRWCDLARLIEFYARYLANTNIYIRGCFAISKKNILAALFGSFFQI
jgi:hypothetical protein